MKLLVGVSKRHVHLTKETLIKLFETDELEVRNYLSQPLEFASTFTVSLKWNDVVIERVRLIGPARVYNQIEISETDSKLFGVTPPRRKSGDILGTLPITLIGPKGEVNLDEGLMLAERHVHLSPDDSIKLSFEDNETVSILKDGKEVMTAKIKIQNNTIPELHIDTDEENIYNLHQGEEVEVCKCGK